jgi:anaerobic magnesium-protoporphyrin IX monomethyl ester cyclase
MKVALVSPPHPHTDAFSGRFHSPLGLLYLGTMIQHEHEVHILDYAQTFTTVCRELFEQLAEIDPDVVGITTSSDIFLINTRQIAAGVRRYCPRAKVVLGGITGTSLHEELIEEPAVDAVVLGEGELTFREMIEALDRRGSFAGVAGVCWKPNGKAVWNGPRAPVQDLDRLPWPDHALLHKAQLIDLRLSSSRGCNFRCPYCAATAFWGKWRARGVENVLGEIAHLYRYYGTRRIEFVDENFCLSAPRVMEFCRALAQAPFRITWGCSARPELLDAPMVKAMQAAGCEGVFLGIESGSDRVLRRLGRRYTAEQALRVVDLCMDAGIVPTVSFIIGLPDEDADDVERTFRLMRRMNTFNVELSMLTPLHGTEIQRHPERYGLELLPQADVGNLLKSRIHTRTLRASEVEALYWKGMGIARKKHKTLGRYFKTIGEPLC